MRCLKIIEILFKEIKEYLNKLTYYFHGIVIIIMMLTSQKFVATFDTIPIKALLELVCLGVEMDKGFAKFIWKCKGPRSRKTETKTEKMINQVSRLIAKIW